VECLTTLELIQPVLPDRGLLRAEIDTVRAVSLARLGRNEQVLKEVDPLLESIGRLKEGPSRSYLDAVVKVVAAHAVRATSGEHSPQPAKYMIDWSKVDLISASARLKRLFPLVTHPHWSSWGLRS
jgi:hypothetical protein